MHHALITMARKAGARQIFKCEVCKKHHGYGECQKMTGAERYFDARKKDRQYRRAYKKSVKQLES